MLPKEISEKYLDPKKKEFQKFQTQKIKPSPPVNFFSSTLPGLIMLMFDQAPEAVNLTVFALGKGI